MLMASFSKTKTVPIRRYSGKPPQLATSKSSRLHRHIRGFDVNGGRIFVAIVDSSKTPRRFAEARRSVVRASQASR